MKTTIQFDSIPWIFKYLIPTKLEVDGIKFPLDHKIDLGEYSKSYGHYRIRMCWGRFIKTNPIIISAESFSHVIKFNIKHKKWFLFLISTIASYYIVFSKPHSKIAMCFLIPLFCIVQLIDVLIIFVEIQETKPQQ